MTNEQIRNILAAGYFPGSKESSHLVETPRSWVILTPEYAFKIKKPVQLDLLDFSTLEKRRFYCGEELRLNRRLAPDMYLGVLPIGTKSGLPEIGGMNGIRLDYAVWMHRMDENRQMDLLLLENEVSTTQLDTLARQLANFHHRAVLSNPAAYTTLDYLQDFEDLYHSEKDLAHWIGPEVTAYFQIWKTTLPTFLDAHANRMRKRFEKRFWVDGHGDLNTRNIFLMAYPVVFDCIEFDADSRRMDVLSDLASLCMDLEARKHPDLAQHFISAYRQIWEIQPEPEDALLFLFFKAYRANLCLKVSLLELRQHQPAALLESVRSYWQLLKNYCARLQPSGSRMG